MTQIKKSTLQVKTSPYTIHNITRSVQKQLSDSDLKEGLANIFVTHTSASLLIQENADPDVLKDLEIFMKKLVPESDHYFHSAEGSDDMPAHIRSALTQTQLSIPFSNGHLQLGTWQGVYLWEHRQFSHHRNLILTFLGT